MASSRHAKYASFLLLLAFLAAMLSIGIGRAGDTAPVTKTGFYFDTAVSITLYGNADPALFAQCFSLCQRYEDMLSHTKEGSDIWNLNNAGGKPAAISEETAFLLETAVFYSALTDGAVDATVAPLSTLWNVTGDDPAVPSAWQIGALLPHVDYRAITIQKNAETYTAMLKDPAAAVSLGFIAKGFIADRLKEYLRSQGITNAIINLGGNVLTIGTKPDGSPFTVGIQKPFASQGESIATLPLADASLVSSGIYERYFTAKDGTLYHHILDTKTGYPVSNNLLGVTILSPSSTAGDALSTACLVLGLEKGLALIESLENTHAIFITSDYALHCSKGLENLKSQ